MDHPDEPALRLALLQEAGAPGDVTANLATLARSAARAREEGADLLVTPEMFVTGYNIGAAALDAVTTDDLPERVARIAREHGLAIAAGMPLRRSDGIANAVVTVGPDGTELQRYEKTHLFGDLDRELFVPGDGLLPPVEIAGTRVATLICYDVEFPETVRRLADLGAELVMVPTAQMEPFAFVAEHLIAVRAWENQVYLAYADRVGGEGELRYVGRSSVVGPDGVVLAAGGPDEPALLVADVVPATVRRAQQDNPYLADRRPELYRPAPGGRR